MASPDRLKAAALAPNYGLAGKLRAIFRLFIILCWIGINLPIQILFQALRLPVRFAFPHWFHSIFVKGLLGIKIDVVGAPSTTKPTFFLSNHLSYADIPVISAVMPASFVSRAEVSSWPLLGLLAKLQNTVFIDRRQRTKIKEQNNSVIDFLKQGRPLVLFPEGTSTDGRQVAAFKSALLQGVFELGQDVVIQPMTLACLNTDGSQHLYPWYGDMDFPEHALPFLQAPHFHMQITFHPTFTARQFADRKALADYAFDQVIKAPYGVKG